MTTIGAVIVITAVAAVLCSFCRQKNQATARYMDDCEAPEENQPLQEEPAAAVANGLPSGTLSIDSYSDNARSNPHINHLANASPAVANDHDQSELMNPNDHQSDHNEQAQSLNVEPITNPATNSVQLAWLLRYIHENNTLLKQVQDVPHRTEIIFLVHAMENDIPRKLSNIIKNVFEHCQTQVRVEFECRQSTDVIAWAEHILRCSSKVLVILTETLVNNFRSHMGSMQEDNNCRRASLLIAPSVLQMLRQEATGFQRIFLAHLGLENAEGLYWELVNLYQCPQNHVLPWESLTPEMEEGNHVSTPVAAVTEPIDPGFHSAPDITRYSQSPPPSYSTIARSSGDSLPRNNRGPLSPEDGLSGTRSRNRPTSSSSQCDDAFASNRDRVTSARCCCGQQGPPAQPRQRSRSSDYDQDQTYLKQRERDVSRDRHHSSPNDGRLASSPPVSPPPYHSMCRCVSDSSTHSPTPRGYSSSSIESSVFPLLTGSIPVSQMQCSPDSHQRGSSTRGLPLFNLKDRSDFSQFVSLVETSISREWVNSCFEELKRNLEPPPREPVQHSCCSSISNSNSSLETLK